MSRSNTTSDSDYSYKVKRTLDTQGLSELAEKHVPKLFELGHRYLPDFDFSGGIPLRSEFLDVVRGGWLLDKRADRPPYDDVVSGIGYAFGLLLKDKFGMQWCIIEDTMGEEISLIKFQSDSEKNYKEMSIPPFNYVAKRKDVQNVEVFSDGMREFEKMVNS